MSKVLESPWLKGVPDGPQQEQDLVGLATNTKAEGKHLTMYVVTPFLEPFCLFIVFHSPPPFFLLFFLF
jgi:hypothetical protein